MAARSMLQSGNWLINVRGAGEVGVSSPFKFSMLTLEPLILGEAWAFALTCKPLDEAGLGLMPLASKLSGIIDAFAEVADDDGEATGKKAEAAAAVATMMRKTRGANHQIKQRSESALRGRKTRQQNELSIFPTDLDSGNHSNTNEQIPNLKIQFF